MLETSSRRPLTCWTFYLLQLSTVEIMVEVMDAGLTDFLISSYHQRSGRPPAQGSGLQTTSQADYSVTFSPAAPSWTLVFLPHFSSNFLSKNLFPHFIFSICYFILFLWSCSLQFAMSSFSKSFTFLAVVYFVSYMENVMWDKNTHA